MARVLHVVMLGLATTCLMMGCKQRDAGPGAQVSSTASAPSETTLGAALTATAQFSAVAAAIKDTGLDGVLGGKASYTLFAPTNAAFDALGEQGQALRQTEQRAALAALLREHIVPGMLTKSDLDDALQRSGGKPLKLRSMGKGTLTVSRDGGEVVVAGADGAQARLTADASVAKNGSALGIDGVLRKLN